MKGLYKWGIWVKKFCIASDIWYKDSVNVSACDYIGISYVQLTWWWKVSYLLVKWKNSLTNQANEYGFKIIYLCFVKRIKLSLNALVLGQNSGMGEGWEGFGKRGSFWPSETTLQVMGHCQDECWGPPAQETEDMMAAVQLRKYEDLLIKPLAPSALISGFSLNYVCCPLLLKMIPPVMLPSWESRCHW